MLTSVLTAYTTSRYPEEQEADLRAAMNGVEELFDVTHEQTTGTLAPGVAVSARKVISGQTITVNGSWHG